jgi:aminomethyltransferase
MDISALRDLHLSRGARFAAGDPSGRPLTYGDVPAEYRAGREGCLLLDESERGLVGVDGADAPDFLHRILATRTRGLAVGEGRRGMLLSSKGKVQHLFDLAAVEGGFSMSTPPGDAAGLVANLDRYLFGEAVTLSDRTAEHAPLAIAGPRADEVLHTLIGEVPQLERGCWQQREHAGGALRVMRSAVAGSLGWRLDAGPERVVALWEALLAAGAGAGGRVAADILRIEALQAEVPADIDDNIYPQEARL